MGRQGIRWIWGATAGLCAATSLQAREIDPRLDAPLLRAGYPRPAPGKAAAKTEALTLLDQTDRNGLRATRMHDIEQAFGAFDLAIEASRLRGGRGGVDEPFGAGDHYGASSVVVNAGFDMGGGLHFGPTAGLMHMKRHFTAVPDGLRPQSTEIATAGLGLWRDDGTALSFGYINTSTRKVRPLDRLAQIAGGAPLVGRGLRFGLSGGGKDARAGRLTWGLSLSALQRPRSEFALDDVAGKVADRRVEVSISRAFR